MTDFDDRFAERVREAFDAYEEPVDEATWARVQTSLAASGAAAPREAAPRAADRAPAAGQRPRRRGAAFALAAVLLAASGVGLWALRGGPAPVPAAPAVATAAPEASPAGSEPPEAADAGEPASPAQPAERDVAVAPVAPRTASGAPPRGSLRPGAAPDGGPIRGAAAPRADGAQPAPAPLPEPTPEAPAPDPSPIAVPDVEIAAADPAAPEPSIVIATPGPLAARPSPEAPPVPPRHEVPPRVTLGLVAASGAVFSAADDARGVSGAAGVTGDVRLGRGVALGSGALVAVNRVDLTPQDALSLMDVRDQYEEGERQDPVTVANGSTLTTVAVEVPLDLAFAAPVRGGRLGVSVGVSSSVYLSQTFDDEGTAYAPLFDETPRGQTLSDVAAGPFRRRETAGVLSRVDLARQLTLGLRYSPERSPLALEGYARLPLGGLTSREASFGALGVRLRYALR